MARPANVQRIVFGFTLPSGEVASTGFWTTINANSGTAQEVANAVVASGSFPALVTGLKGIMNQGTAFATVTVYQYRTTDTAATDKGQAAVANGAGISSVNMPLTNCLVMSLRTANATRSGRGRMYFPATGLTPVATGLFVASDTTTVRAPLATFLSNRDVVVVSETRSATYPVIRVENDTRPDVMRSRSDALRPAYAASTVAN